MGQIKKLRIIWYKQLKKLKMLEDFQEVLSELGILSQVEAYRKEGTDNSIDLDQT